MSNMMGQFNANTISLGQGGLLPLQNAADAKKNIANNKAKTA